MKSNISKLNFLVAVLLFTLFSDIGFASEKRTGLNFGANFFLVESKNNTAPSEISKTKNESFSTSHGVSPFIGYSFGLLNFGVAFSAESSKENVVEKSTDGQSEIKRDISRTTQGANAFVRFNFGKFFYFEGASGLYQDQIDVKNEYQISTGENEFEGSKDEYSLKSVGPGYHLAGGAEIPIADGFFINLGYQLRIMNLSELKSKTQIGGKKIYTQKRSVIFGLEHYMN